MCRLLALVLSLLFYAGVAQAQLGIAVATIVGAKIGGNELRKTIDRATRNASGLVGQLDDVGKRTLDQIDKIVQSRVDQIDKVAKTNILLAEQLVRQTINDIDALERRMFNDALALIAAAKCAVDETAVATVPWMLGTKISNWIGLSEFEIEAPALSEGDVGGMFRISRKQTFKFNANPNGVLDSVEKFLIGRQKGIRGETPISALTQTYEILAIQAFKYVCFAKGFEQDMVRRHVDYIARRNDIIFAVGGLGRIGG